jgi:hypothetical protein
MVAIAVVLLFVGLYLATNGSIVATLQSFLGDSSAFRTYLASAGDKLKAMERPQLLTYYGLMIVAGAIVAAAIGGFIRSYQFRFLPHQQRIERRALWLFLPARFLLWIALFLLLAPADYWLIRPLVGSALFLPVWIMLTAGLALILCVVATRFLRPWLRFYVGIPSWRTSVPFTRVRRLEIQPTSEGGTILAIVLHNGAQWCLCHGRVGRLKRLGDVIARILGLKNRDLTTWT